jgi:hypothetical protein
MKTIEMTKKVFVKNPNTKTTYILESSEVEMIDEQTHGLTTSEATCKTFRRWGGSETVERAYTSQGYKVVKLTSTSPDRQTKIVRTFNFDKL